jgi:protein O-GlcNAc transferase
MAQPAIDLAFQLAVQHHQAGQLLQAETLYRRILAQQPGNAGARNNLSMALSSIATVSASQGQLDKAIAANREAISLRPGVAALHNNLAIALIDAGQVDEAQGHFTKAMELEPDNSLFASASLCCLHYRPAYDGPMITAEHVKWNARYAEPLRKQIQPHLNDRTIDRRLRVGYVSRDLRNHAVGRFLLPLLENHDHRQFEIFCYSDVPVPDAITARFKSVADQWRDIIKLNHDEVARQIRADAIDILVDLSGHTTRNRLLVFARKPAPVRVSYLGYPATTGLTTIAYRLTDHLADPPGLTEHLHTETLYRLPRTNWCFAEPNDAPPIQPPPSIRGGHITFGSFNNIAKLTTEMLQDWARILRRTPNSQLLLKAAGLVSTITCEGILRTLQAAGIDATRVTLQGPQPDHAAHLAAYNSIDIALDTAPYHGTTTTCDALWMGVPVVTLAGQTHVSRVGVSLLTNIGLGELVASNADHYIQLAVDLANDPNRLETMRHTLRQRMKESPLMDAAGFARDVEEAYREMWRR